MEPAIWVDALQEVEAHDVLPQDREGAFVSGPRTPDCPRVSDGELCEDFDDDLFKPEADPQAEAFADQIARCLLGDDECLEIIKAARDAAELARDLAPECGEGTLQGSPQRVGRGRKNRGRGGGKRSGKTSHKTKAWGGVPLHKRNRWW